ncbi:MAG: hypothetical protein KDI65_03260 [Alphaproteobacteria bacterium]|nr:hypothetical protein [Alphaproteobacteria bacterium]
MLSIDFENPPIWKQVKDARGSDLEELGYYDRYAVMHAVGQEYVNNLIPTTAEDYRALIRQEMILRDLHNIDAREPIYYPEDQAAIESFGKNLIESGTFKKWQEAWENPDPLKRRGIILQIKRAFGQAFGADISGGKVKHDDTVIMPGDVADYSEDFVFQEDPSVQQNFLKVFHTAVYASARVFQERLARGKIKVEAGSDREDLAWRCHGDVPSATSLFWDSDEFRFFMGQPTRRHASWLADSALRAVTGDSEDPEIADEVIRELNEAAYRRYLSSKVLYACNMKVLVPHDVWHAISPISQKHIRNISIEAQSAVVDLAEKIHKKGEVVPPELNNAIEKIISSYPLTREYRKFQAEQQARLLKRMLLDPKVAEAKANWHTYNENQKLEFLQRVTKMHADVFGYRPSLVVAVDEAPEPDPNDPTRNKSVSLGWYDWTKSYPELAINVNEEVGGLENFFQALNTAMHEAEHAFQDHLARRYESGFLKPDSPLYEQARYFSIARYIYVNPKQNRTHYRNNALERDSFAMGNGVSFFIALANRDQQEEYSQRLEDMFEDPRGKDLDLSRGFENVPWRHHPPMPEPDGYS